MLLIVHASHGIFKCSSYREDNSEHWRTTYGRDRKTFVLDHAWDLSLLWKTATDVLNIQRQTYKLLLTRLQVCNMWPMGTSYCSAIQRIRPRNLWGTFPHGWNRKVWKIQGSLETPVLPWNFGISNLKSCRLKSQPRFYIMTTRRKLTNTRMLIYEYYEQFWLMSHIYLCIRDKIPERGSKDLDSSNRPVGGNVTVIELCKHLVVSVDLRAGGCSSPSAAGCLCCFGDTCSMLLGCSPRAGP